MVYWKDTEILRRRIRFIFQLLPLVNGLGQVSRSSFKIRSAISKQLLCSFKVLGICWHAGDIGWITQR